MEKYVFSGALTDRMHDLLLQMPDFQPLDILVSQIDRNAIKKTIEWKHELNEDGVPFCGWLLVDSGAFSIHTGKANTTQEEYVEYLNEIDDDVDVCAQLDTIPGHLNQPKSPEDYRESAEKSWENFLYMRSHMKSPHKVMPVFHYGEDFSALGRMLSWRDSDGNLLDYIGISPANDTDQKYKNMYLQNVADYIANSENPDVKTHLYAMTSLDALSKYPCYSTDSISHRLISGYAKVLSVNFGVISVSSRRRTSGGKSSMSFLDTADDYNLKLFQEEVESLGLTMDGIINESADRVAMTMHNIQQLVKTRYAYHPSNVHKSKSFFA